MEFNAIQDISINWMIEKCVKPCNFQARTHSFRTITPNNANQTNNNLELYNKGWDDIEAVRSRGNDQEDRLSQLTLVRFSRI